MAQIAFNNDGMNLAAQDFTVVDGDTTVYWWINDTGYSIEVIPGFAAGLTHDHDIARLVPAGEFSQFTVTNNSGGDLTWGFNLSTSRAMNLHGTAVVGRDGRPGHRAEIFYLVQDV